MIEPTETESGVLKAADGRVLTRLWDWKDITLMFVIFLFLFIIGQVVTLLLAGVTFTETGEMIMPDDATFPVLVYGLIGTMLAMLIPYFGVNAIRKKHSLATLGLGTVPQEWVWPAVWAGIGASLIRMALGAGLIELFPVLAESAEELGEMFAFEQTWQMVIVGLLATLVVPVYEEIFFRGLIHNGIANRIGFWGAILISSALFSLFHGFPIQIITAFLLGLVLGWLYEKSDNLWIPIICHVVNNGIAMGLSVLSFIFEWGI